MLLAFLDGKPFATGAIKYMYETQPGEISSLRIIMPLEIEGIPTTAIVDTAAPYVVCAPDVAAKIGLKTQEALYSIRLQLRGTWYHGHIHRLDILLPAETGETLTVDATAFVPDMHSAQAWGQLPSFIGMGGCLERMRFAVDPAEDTFYFGPLP